MLIINKNEISFVGIHRNDDEDVLGGTWQGGQVADCREEGGDCRLSEETGDFCCFAFICMSLYTSLCSAVTVAILIFWPHTHRSIHIFEEEVVTTCTRNRCT
jgi:hypothetical protein